MGSQNTTPRILEPGFSSPNPADIAYKIETHRDSPGEKPTYTIESLEVFDGYSSSAPEGVKLMRELEIDGTLDSRRPIETEDIALHPWTGKSRYYTWGARSLAFPGKSPCTLREFKRIDFQNKRQVQKCFPAGVPHEGWSPSRDALYDGNDGAKIDQRIQDIVVTAARHYAAQVGSALPSDRTVIKGYEFDQTGKKTESLNVRFNNSSLKRSIEDRETWEMAQECGKLDQRFPIVGGFLPTPSAHLYVGCFNVQSYGDFSVMPDYTQKHYDETLVGKLEPEKPLNAIEHITIADQDVDGTVDSVSGRFSKHGQLEIPIRSSYTQSVLAYFDNFVKGVEPTEFEYTLRFQPLALYVKDKSRVKAGQKLFTVASPEEVTKTITAEVDGLVAIESDATFNNWWRLSLKKAPAVQKQSWWTRRFR